MQTRFDWPEPKDFAAYHAANPQIYAALRRFALEARQAGVKRLGIAALFERLRWYTAVEAKDDAWKCNNSMRAGYARLLMAQEPALAGLFETRNSRADAAQKVTVS